MSLRNILHNIKIQTTTTTTTTAECDEVNPTPTPPHPSRRWPVAHAPLFGHSKPKRHLQPNAKCRKRRANEQQAMPSSSASFFACFCSPSFISSLSPPPPVPLTSPPPSRCCCSWRRSWRGCFCGRFSTLLPALLVSDENEFFFSYSFFVVVAFLHPPNEVRVFRVDRRRCQTMPGQPHSPLPLGDWVWGMWPLLSSCCLLHRSPAPADDGLLLCAQLLNQWWRRV